MMYSSRVDLYDWLAGRRLDLLYSASYLVTLILPSYFFSEMQVREHKLDCAALGNSDEMSINMLDVNSILLICSLICF